eukprot:166872_1
MACLKALSKIDKRTKYLVNGWIRNNEKLFKLNHIPLLISSICILYVRDDDTFAITGTQVRLSHDKKCVEKIQNHVAINPWNNTSYGKIHISPKYDNICTWELKINNIGTVEVNGNIMIGISSTESSTDDTFDVEEDGINYVLCNDGMTYDNETEAWKEYAGTFAGQNDKISICLDLKKGEISFSINDNNQGVAYKDIEQGNDIKYKLFVSLRSIGDSVEIVKFSKT